MSYVRVVEDDGCTPVELETEESDDDLLVSTLQAQFPQAIGLRYLPDPAAGIYRGVRCINSRLKPPKEGWEGTTFYCTYPSDSKRKVSESEDESVAYKKPRSREVKCSDLIVLGLSFNTTNDSLKKYFEDKFGPLLMALVKTDLSTKRSKGFGFIRFTKYEDQVKALSARKHEIDGRWVTIKPPFAKEGVESSLPSKVFISRLTPDMSTEDLNTYFSKFGEVADVFFPMTPFRGFAFLTFVSPDSADEVIDTQPHIIKNVSVSVTHATDQQKKPSYRFGQGGGRGGRLMDRYSRNYDGGRYSSRGSYNGGNRGYSRDYDSYNRRDNYSNYSNYSSNSGSAPPEEIAGKILAAALKNPSTISNLLNNLGPGKGPGPAGGGSRNNDYGRGGGDYDDNDDYNDYSYNDKYQSYQEDKGYGGGGGSSKYGNSRY